MSELINVGKPFSSSRVESRTFEYRIVQFKSNKWIECFFRTGTMTDDGLRDELQLFKSRYPKDKFKLVKKLITYQEVV